MHPHNSMQSLSVQSYHNDSPPFTGATDRYLEPVQPFELDGGPSGRPPALQLSGRKPSYADETPRVSNGGQALPPVQPFSAAIPHTEARASRPGTPNFIAMPNGTASRGSGASTSSVPASPQESFFVGPDEVIGPMGSKSAYTDLDRPSRMPSPVDLKATAANYDFPKQRLATKMVDESKTPLVIVACGSFSPPTYLHLRMFEMAKDAIVEGGEYEILGGYYSPVSDTYKKTGLAPAMHRVRMCELAVDQTSSWLMVDPWEASQDEYQRTAVVLVHFDEHLNRDGGINLTDGTRKKIKIVLLAGGDLIESFGEPGVWSEPDLHIILGRFGCCIIERTGSDVWAFLLSHDILYQHRRNVIVVKQLIYNDISSTKVRLFVKRGMSIKYLLPNSVIQYIYDHGLYAGPKAVEPPLKGV